MFTPGFKLFAGMATLGLIGAFVYGLSAGDVSGPDYFGFVDRNAIIGLISLGWKGNIGQANGVVVLLFMSMTAAFLGTTVVAFRDADVESVAQLGDTPSVMPLAQRPTAPSWWPAASAVGLGVLLIGLVLDTKAFWIIGLVILSAVAIEWALSAWADRSTGDPATNSVLRDRLVAGFEIPFAAVAVGAVIALSMSRIFLWTAESFNLGAVVVAGVVSLIVMGVALLAVFRPKLGRNTMVGIVGSLLVVTVALGIVTSVTDPCCKYQDEHGEEHNEADAE